MLDSGNLDNPARSTNLVFEEVIFLGADVPWVRVVFAEANLPPGSVVRVTSQQDLESQTLDATQLANWGNGTAFFNGPAVRVELLAGPGTKDNRVRIEHLLAGVSRGEEPFGGINPICGAIDSRRPDKDPRIGRLLEGNLRPEGPGSVAEFEFCTAFIINDGIGNDKLHMTAAHCFTPQVIDPRFGPPLVTTYILQFNISCSDDLDCTPQHPPVADQFCLDRSSLISYPPTLATGNKDFAVFRCHPNPDPLGGPSQTTYQHSGLRAFTRAEAPSIVPHNARVTGYGRDGNKRAPTSSPEDAEATCACPMTEPGDGSYNLMLQTAVGQRVGNYEENLTLEVDACLGDSGSPVIFQSMCPNGLSDCPNGVPCVRQILEDITTCDDGNCPEGFHCVTEAGADCPGGGPTCTCTDLCPNGAADCPSGWGCVSQFADDPCTQLTVEEEDRCDRRCSVDYTDCICDIHEWSSSPQTFTGTVIGIARGGSCEHGPWEATPTVHPQIQSAIDWLVLRGSDDSIAIGCRYLQIAPGCWHFLPDTEVPFALHVTGTDGNVACLDKYIDAQGYFTATPVYRTHAEWGIVTVRDEFMLPSDQGSSSIYHVVKEYEGASPPFDQMLGDARAWLWGDTSPVGGNNLVDVDDILCVLAAFMGIFDENCTPRSADIAICPPNDAIDVDDITAVQNAFLGEAYVQYAQTFQPPCPLPCPTRSEESRSKTEDTRGTTAPGIIRLAPRQTVIAPGDTVPVDAFVRGLDELRAFEIRATAQGGSSGRLELVDILIDSSRPNFIFPTGIVDSAADLPRRRFVASRRGGGTRVSSERYLVTFVFRASADAAGSFEIVAAEATTRLRDPQARPIRVIIENKASISVEVARNGGAP